MRQQALSTALDSSFEKHRKPTRKEKFLTEMEAIIPWKELCRVIEPRYPKPKGASRPPVGIEWMLRKTQKNQAPTTSPQNPK